MRPAYQAGLLGFLMAGVARCQYPWGLPYFIPCTGPWANGQTCPSDAYCWNIGISDWSLCRPNSMRIDPNNSTSAPTPASPGSPGLLSLVSFFGDKNCGGTPETFNTTGVGGADKGECVTLNQPFPSLLVSQVGKGCTVVAYIDDKCSESPVDVEAAQCLTIGNAEWGSFSTDKCA